MTLAACNRSSPPCSPRRAGRSPQVGSLEFRCSLPRSSCYRVARFFRPAPSWGGFSSAGACSCGLHGRSSKGGGSRDKQDAVAVTNGSTTSIAADPLAATVAHHFACGHVVGGLHVASISGMGDRDLRGAFLRAPWWVLSAIAGVIFGIGQFLTNLGEGRSTGASATGALIAGLIFGLIMGPFSARQHRRFLAAQGDVPRESQREVRRAVMRGPAPSDPEVRAAAARVVALQLTQLHRLWWGVILWVALVALALWLAVSESPWWLLCGSVSGGFLAYELWLPRHLQQRERLLASSRPSTLFHHPDRGDPPCSMRGGLNRTEP